MSKDSYTAEAIEVLTGLEPVRKRPGMYTQTERPNHLAQEVIDNSVDEAIAGHATRVEVTLFKDGSLQVRDDGRGMPVDIHPREKLPGVEVILTRLHAGGKFSDKNYKFSGGLHGVGVSVVNALSKKLEVWIRRGGKEYHMAFADGKPVTRLEVVGTVGKRNTGTTIRFWPDPKYFDSPNFSIPRLKHVLRAKAVLCPGLTVVFHDENTGETEEAVDWALAWVPDGSVSVAESYVNLIPTAQGGTHVNGLRTGLTEALREFCEFRNLIPRGVKITPEDVWDKISYVLSVKLADPQFSGQTKERLSSRECAAFVSGVVKDAFALWLNQHIEEAEPRIRNGRSCSWWRATRPGARPSRAGTASSRPSCPCAARS